MKNLLSLTYYIFAIIYAFKFWGIGWGLLSIILPVFPLIDLAIFILNQVGRIGH